MLNFLHTVFLMLRFLTEVLLEFTIYNRDAALFQGTWTHCMQKKS